MHGAMRSRYAASAFAGSTGRRRCIAFSPPRLMRLRELRFDDDAGTAAVLVRNGLRRPTREQWAYLWNANPHREQLAGVPLGWVLEHDTDGLVGAFRNIPFLYEWNG